MESYFYISPCFSLSSHPPRLHSPFCLMLLLMLHLPSAASIRDGPFSFMQPQPIWLEWVHGRERGIPAALRRIISNDVFCIRSVPPDRPVRLPPLHLVLPLPPLPPVFTVQSHTEQIGTEQLSEAEGTRFHCGANWTLSQPSSLHLLSLHLWPTPHHPSTL